MIKNKLENNGSADKLKDRILKSPIEQKNVIVMQLMEKEIKERYINTGLYVRTLGLELQFYCAAVKRIEKTNPEFYEWYCTEKANNYSKFVENAKIVLEQMRLLINNGVLLQDGTVRKFDDIDCVYFINNYFQGFGRQILTPILNSIDTYHIFHNVREILGRCYFDCPSFTNSLNYFSPEQLRKDNNYNLSDEDKEIIIKFFEENNITYNLTTYYAAAKRIERMKKDGNNYFLTKYIVPVEKNKGGKKILKCSTYCNKQ